MTFNDDFFRASSIFCAPEAAKQLLHSLQQPDGCGQRGPGFDSPIPGIDPDLVESLRQTVNPDDGVLVGLLRCLNKVGYRHYNDDSRARAPVVQRIQGILEKNPNSAPAILEGVQKVENFWVDQNMRNLFEKLWELAPDACVEKTTPRLVELLAEYTGSDTETEYEGIDTKLAEASGLLTRYARERPKKAANLILRVSFKDPVRHIGIFASIHLDFLVWSREGAELRALLWAESPDEMAAPMARALIDALSIEPSLTSQKTSFAALWLRKILDQCPDVGPSVILNPDRNTRWHLNFFGILTSHAELIPLRDRLWREHPSRFAHIAYYGLASEMLERPLPGATAEGWLLSFIREDESLTPLVLRAISFDHVGTAGPQREALHRALEKADPTTYQQKVAAHTERRLREWREWDTIVEKDLQELTAFVGKFPEHAPVVAQRFPLKMLDHKALSGFHAALWKACPDAYADRMQPHLLEQVDALLPGLISPFAAQAQSIKSGLEEPTHKFLAFATSWLQNFANHSPEERAISIFGDVDRRSDLFTGARKTLVGLGLPEVSAGVVAARLILSDPKRLSALLFIPQSRERITQRDLSVSLPAVKFG